MAKRGLIVIACAALLAACSSPGQSSSAPPVEQGTPATIAPGPSDQPAGRDAHHAGKGREGESDHGDAAGGSNDTTGGDGGEGNGDGDAAPSGGGGSSAAGSHEAASPYPAAGAYVFAQSGTEAFCDPAGNCDQEDLPRRQSIAARFQDKSATEAVMVQTARMSEGRVVRTTLHFTNEAAFVTDVYYRLQYEGFDLSQEYRPDPPVPSIRWPLETGEEWSATWSADTSGDYHARVTGVDEVRVGDATVGAFRIETLAHFRGEYKGKASAVVWVDPKTKAVVATNGALELRATYGNYNTTFRTRLASGPGY